MVIDARQVAEGDRLETDLCIIGAGAAGIAIAREFAGRGVRVCLVESGGRAFDRRVQSLYRGENRGPHHWPLVQSRVRTYGGSTAAWDGRCRPLDPIDFEARAWVAGSGWPFPKRALDPYYDRAAALLDLHDGDWDAAPPGRPPLFAGTPALRTVPFRYARVLNFAAAYGPALEAADNITLLLHANVTQIATTGDGRRAVHLQIQTLSGRRFTLAARLFVLAAGGIENPRLLLASNQTHAAGLGNAHDLVGRYLMNHPHHFFGVLAPAPGCPPLDAYVTPFHARKTVTGAWTFSENLLRRERLVNAAVYLTPRPAFKAAPAYFSPGMEALNLTLAAARLGNLPDDVAWQARQMAGGMGAIGQSLLGKLAGRGTYPVLRVALENAPNRESRVTLSARRDALGQPRAAVQWHLAEIDWRSYRQMVKVLQSAFARRGYGRVRLFFDPDGQPWPLPVQDGKHHMGATRMHRDPRHGVVDPDGRVHGLGNLFVAGSSVFPTGGHANPTFTLLALALRLADCLKAELGEA